MTAATSGTTLRTWFIRSHPRTRPATIWLLEADIDLSCTANLILALEKHLGEGAAVIMCSPFITSSVDEMRTLFDEAGFDDIRVVIRTVTQRFPAVSELVRQEIASIPVPGVQAEMVEAQEQLLGR